MWSGAGDHRGVDATVYPAGLRLSGRVVVVVGGGTVGQRRIGGLLAARADVLGDVVAMARPGPPLMG